MTTVSDSFTTGANAELSAYSATWQIEILSSVINVLAASDDFYPARAANALAYSYVSALSTGNQYAQIVVNAISDASFVGALVRANGAGNFYGFYEADSSDYTFVCVAESFTQLGSTGGGGALNDTVRIEADGTTITSKRNGGTVRTTTNGDVTDGVYAGLFCYGNSSDTRGDNFEGGDLSGAVTLEISLTPETARIQGVKVR